MGCCENKTIVSNVANIKRKARVSILGNINNFDKYYIIQEKLFEKECEKIFLVKHTITDEIRIMKSVLISSLNNIEEIIQISLLDHINIIKLYEYYVDDVSYHFIFEYVPVKLLDKLYKVKFFNENNAIYIMKQIFSTITYLHDNNLTFRYFTCSSIYFETNREDDFNVKILYLGKSLFFSKHIRVRSLKDDPSYMAPEVYKEEYDSKSDMWTLGVILYTLICGYTPFQGKDRTEILEKVIEGKFNINSHDWDIISDEAKDLVKKLLSYNPKYRPSAKECMTHPWISSYQKRNFGIKRLKTVDINYFKSTKKLNKAVIEYLIHQNATNKNYTNLRNIFREIDISGNGYLSYQDMKQAWKKCFAKTCRCDLEFDKFFNMVDIKKHKRVEWEEFLKITLNYEDLLSERNLKSVFEFLDKDNTGKISVNNLKDSFYGEDDEISELVRSIMLEIDKFGNEQEISFDDFKHIITEIKNNDNLMRKMNSK